jgi:hypothetical protein
VPFRETKDIFRVSLLAIGILLYVALDGVDLGIRVSFQDATAAVALGLELRRRVP